MFKRGIASLALAGTLSLAVAVPAVFADTFPAGHGNIFSGAGATEDGSAQVIALIGTEDGAPVHTLAAFTFIVEDVTCPDGSDGIILTALNATTDDATIKVDGKLNSATASGTVSGTEETFHSCTDEDVIVDVTRSVTLTLHASGGSRTTKTHTVTKNPDGSTDTFNETLTDNFAGGTFTIGSTHFAASELVSVVEHDVFSTSHKAPKHKH